MRQEGWNDTQRVAPPHGDTGSSARHHHLGTKWQHVVINLARDHKLSWMSYAISIISYALVVTDVPHAGLGTQQVPKGPALEPDSFVNFGPYAYLTNHITTSDILTDATSKYWVYKYDTKSIAMRSVAQYLGLPSWSPCLLYKTECDESLGVPISTVFSMIDELVSAVKIHPSATSTRHDRHQLVLRSECRYRDRLHHYVLPWFFQATTKRTNHISYHAWNATGSATSICSKRTDHPYSCAENWTRYSRLRCEDTGLLVSGTTSNDTLTNLVTRRVPESHGRFRRPR